MPRTARARKPFSPHHWLHCPVHGTIAVHRSFPDVAVQWVVDQHAQCARESIQPARPPALQDPPGRKGETDETDES